MRFSKKITLFAAAALLLAACCPKVEKGIRRATPLSQGMSASHLELIDSAVNAAIADLK